MNNGFDRYVYYIYKIYSNRLVSSHGRKIIFNEYYHIFELKIIFKYYYNGLIEYMCRFKNKKYVQ